MLLELPNPLAGATTYWEKLSAPDDWQLDGYGKHRYANTQFPILVYLLSVSTENPTGGYHRVSYVPRI